MMLSYIQRSAIEQRILQRVASLKKGFRQNLSVLGPDGIGKSRLLESLYTHLRRDSEVLAVYVQCQALDFPDFAERWITAVLASVISPREDGHEPISTHLATLEARLPLTVTKIRGLRKMIRRGEKNAATVRELFGLTALLSTETNKKVVIILDEFHTLDELPVQDPFGLLGHQIMLEKNTLYLAASSRASLSLEIFKNQLSLLFSNFETLHMGALDSLETVQFMEDLLPGVLFTETQRKFMVRMTGGMPLYLDLLLEHIRLYADSKSVQGEGGVREHAALRLDDEQLLQAFEREVFEPHGRLSQIFQRKLERSLGAVKDGAVFYGGLIAISEGARKVSSIAAHVERKTLECKKILQRLVQEELVVKHNDFFIIEDSLFSFWIREVFAARSRQSVPFKNNRSRFRATLTPFLEQSDFESPEKIFRQTESLLKSFRNESLQIGHKKFKLPHFNEVSMRVMNAGKSCSFTARGSTVSWYGNIAYDLIHEEDILLQKEEIRTGKKTAKQQFTIALGGIDQNAKLMAQEAGIHLWLLNDLNRLFLLFNLPQLIGTRKLDGSTLGTLAQSIYPA